MLKKVQEHISVSLNTTYIYTAFNLIMFMPFLDFFLVKQNLHENGSMMKMVSIMLYGCQLTLVKFDSSGFFS